MARFYSNENFPLPVVEELRRLGHQALTSFDAGNAHRGAPDVQVLAFAAEQHMILLTLNRKDFRRLHEDGAPHSGILACSVDPDFVGQATRIHQLWLTEGDLSSRLLHLHRPPPR